MTQKTTDTAGSNEEFAAKSVRGARYSGRTVSFTIPSLPRPHLRRQNSLPAWSRKRAAGFLAFFVAVVLGSGFAGAWFANRMHTATLTTGSLSGQRKIVTSQSKLISQIAKTVGPSVVSVNVRITDQSNQASLYDLYGYTMPSTQSEAAGTGIVVSKSGIIMTNRHVVPAGTTKVSVTLSDGTELKNVTVIGRTNDSDSLDIAFLKINDLEGHTLTPAVIGDSSTVQIGDDAIAIGNALGQFQNTVTSGIISGYGRSIQAGDSSGSQTAENLDNLFQTDAAINEGNSGGPLVNLNGQVIGINTAVAGNAQNIGFAIPINDVRGLIQQVLKTGSFKRPYVGIRYVPLSADIAKEYNLSTERGIYILPAADNSSPSIVPDSPASKSDLREGDVITQVNGKNIDATHSFLSLIGQHQPGDKVVLTIVRDTATKQIRVTLGAQPTSN